MLVHNVAADGVTSPDGGVIRALGSRESIFRKTYGQIGIGVDQRIFLLQSKPEIIAVIIDGGAAVGYMWGPVGIENLAHDQPSVTPEAAWIRVHGHGLQEAVRIVSLCLLGR